MSSSYPAGRLLAGRADTVAASHARFSEQAVDQTCLCEGNRTGFSERRTTIRQKAAVTGPGTFYRRALRTLTFQPSRRDGWWIRRTDLHEALPFRVSIRNVWTSHRNIVLRSGSQHNYLRMVEHIVALRLGMGIDDLMIATDAGDPPLFDRGSLDLVEALETAGIAEQEEPAAYVTVKEPVTIGGDRGDFVTLLPAERGMRKLRIDCAVDFASAIGRQRIVFDVTADTFRHGAAARTNAALSQMVLAKTVGVLFADMRNLGYTRRNILIHGKRRYINEPRLLHEGRSLEAAWHRATLDLLAAIALIDTGRFVGTAVSYRAGHTLDTRLMTLLYLHDLLEPAR